MKNRYYSQTQFNDDVKFLASSIQKDSWAPDYIVGLVRGGLIAATCLSHKLNCPLMPLRWSASDDFKCHSDFDDILFQVELGKNILFVDDLVDSGNSLSKLFVKLEENTQIDRCRVAVLLYNNDIQLVDTESKSIKAYCSTSFSRSSDTRWVQFWWED